jgi:hypothetical protein
MRKIVQKVMHFSAIAVLFCAISSAGSDKHKPKKVVPVAEPPAPLLLAVDLSALLGLAFLLRKRIVRTDN